MSADRLLELLAGPDPSLDRLLAVIGTVVPNAPTEQALVSELDRLADQVPGDAPEAIITDVFGGLGFTGNAANYYDARNSLLHSVVERRLGIPLSLAIVVIEIGRRRGVEFQAVGMPGHVLLSCNDRWFDPFAAGAPLDRTGCEQIFRSLHADAPFLDEYLAPMDAATVAARTLANLRVASMGSGQLSQLAAVLELRAELPGAPVDFRIEYARVLSAIGRYDQAARQRDQLAQLTPTRSEHHLAEAIRLRANRN